MLKKYFLLVCVCMSLYTQGQVVNVNPDPNGPPWWAGGVRELTPEDYDKLEAMSELQLTEASENTPLPIMVDNTTQKFMRPAFDQEGGSCGQAAGIGYTFTYEINRVRDLPANNNSLTENHYPTHYTWNFLNGGNGGGSWYFEGWDIVKENGCPNVDDWGGMFGTDSIWMSGYDKYYRGMHNRVKNYYRISFGSVERLNVLKHWLNDHATGDATGGVACFAVKVLGGIDKVVLPPESYAAGEPMIVGWGYNAPHAMTIVGYNDSIKYDFNGDGQFTNHIDTNGDGIVNLEDYEIGALQLLNSWDTTGQIVGSKYIAYRLLSDHNEWHSHVMNSLCAISDYQPQITYKIRMQDSWRSHIKLQVGYSSISDETPLEIKEYSSFNKQGGRHYMQPVDEGPLEFGLDVGYWFLDNEAAKYYFIVNRTEGGGYGEIESFSLIDYRWGETFEVPCEQTNVPIPYNIGSTMLSVNYDLLPHEAPITEDLIVNNTKISRFTTRVDDGATLEIANGKTIEMYNSTIIISSDALLSLGNKSKIVAKQGNCEIIINGNIEMGQRVRFIKDGADEFKITINQDENSILFNDADFTGVSLESYVEDLEVKNCSFIDVQTFSTKGNINIHDCSFNNSHLLITSSEKNNYYLTIKKCVFNSPTQCPKNAIDISTYKNILISQNHINNYKNGIYLFICGQNQSDALLVYDNEIKNCLDHGIIAYHASGNMIGNNIYNNQIGVALHNACNMNIYGDVPNYIGVKSNIIHDNDTCQIYISENSFPPHFRLNKIIDEDNTVPLVFYDANTEDVKNMAYNCFGNNFNPSEDLYPLPTLDYKPVYCYTAGFTDTLKKASHEEQYEEGVLALSNNNLANAKDIFKGVIENYPNTTSSQAALKALFDTEALGNQDFSNLKSFYDSNTVIQNHPNLQKLARGLSNNCDVSMEAYQQAINYYENIIANPESTSDSIYAIIDLGYVYLLMQNGTGDKGQDLGKYYNYTKSSLTNYIPYRDKLLSLLPDVKKDKPYDTFFGLPHQTCEAYVAPNPFTQSTTVHYSLQHKARMRYVLYNYLGQEVTAAALGVQPQGDNTFQINNIPAGIYMLQLWVDNKPIATLKIQSNK